MSFRLATRWTVVAFGLGMAAFGQDGAGPAPQASPGMSMGVLQPAVVSLQSSLDGLRVDKWKASREVKAATTQNVESIRRDVEGTLPGLVTAADGASASLAAMLPLTRNVGALYDVVLRVTVIAESAAPGDQADALEKALIGLESARHTLADRQQQMAAAAEAKTVDLQKQLNARPAVAVVCPPVGAAVPAKTVGGVTGGKKKRVKPAAAAPSAATKPAG